MTQKTRAALKTQADSTIYENTAGGITATNHNTLVNDILDSVPTISDNYPIIQSIIIACSDEVTAITTGLAKAVFRMPFAFTLTEVRASLSTAPTTNPVIVDINESGTTILSTKLYIDAGEKTSTTASTAAVISDASLADDAEITIDIDQIGSGTATGLKVTLIGYIT